MLKHFGKDFGESLFVVFWHMSHANVVKIDLVLLVEQTALHAEF
jgi:hypothetical protein